MSRKNYKKIKKSFFLKHLTACARYAILQAQAKGKRNHARMTEVAKDNKKTCKKNKKIYKKDLTFRISMLYYKCKEREVGFERDAGDNREVTGLGAETPTIEAYRELTKKNKKKNKRY